MQLKQIIIESRKENGYWWDDEDEDWEEDETEDSYVLRAVLVAIRENAKKNNEKHTVELIETILDETSG